MTRHIGMENMLGDESRDEAFEWKIAGIGAGFIDRKDSQPLECGRVSNDAKNIPGALLDHNQGLHLFGANKSKIPVFPQAAATSRGVR